MATSIIPGSTEWSMERDEESHRTYKLKVLVKGLSTDGPANAIQTPGLPQYGDVWNIDGDVDLWAFCRYPCKVRPLVTGEPNRQFECEFTFSTKPDTKFCMDQQIQDPLLKPPELSGGSVKYTEQATFDRFGNPIVNSAWEPFQGPSIEFDKNRHKVHIEMPVPVLNLGFVSLFVDMVNAFILWGCLPRTIKLSQFDWKRNFYGVCFPYYTWIFDFEINFKSFDRDILDSGTKVLNGHWDNTTGNWILDNIGGQLPSAANPQHFMRYVDRAGNPQRVILDGFGLPAGVLIGTGTSAGAQGCSACGATGTPTSASLFPNGHFQQAYAAYEGLINGAATPLVPVTGDPCLLRYTAGLTMNADLLWTVDPISGLGKIRLQIYPPPGSPNPTPSVEYTAENLPLVNGKLDCSQTYALILRVGSSDNCPESFAFNVSVATDTSYYSGPPGFRHVEKYDEADFTLLGIPLVF